ncbi:hypothetical protein DNTS_009782 [Danionella cerebrum]|uniref:Uncharacterized protein n=1 Tax=Danionella cerebrum TaxID=2873325 RepID=A0A553QL75_9TELE|nr:hypothetical protein DNTS_009782 [Danionella translucida]
MEGLPVTNRETMKLGSTAVGSRSQNCVRAPERETSENSPAGLFSYFNSKDFDSALNLYPLFSGHKLEL